MPTTRKVAGVSWRQGRRQRRLTAWRISGVARGTTLQIAAPSNRARLANLTTSFLAAPSNQDVVGIVACLTTRLELARPQCVLVLPISKSRIISRALHLRPRPAPG